MRVSGVAADSGARAAGQLGGALFDRQQQAAYALRALEVAGIEQKGCRARHRLDFFR